MNPTDPQWVSQNSPHAKVAVVFIHGVFGDTLGTWKNPNGHTFFQFLSESPGMGPKVDVFAFGFTSNLLKGGSLNINEAANKLHDSLQYAHVLDYPAVVFVAHSMGGLVTLRYLLSHPVVAQKVPLVVFYATPQEGSQIALIADKVAHNPALAQMMPADGNLGLQQLSEDWGNMPIKPKVSCAYEKVPTDGIMIVPWSSATRFCTETPVAIENSDHLTIVKPDRLQHPSVVHLVNALNQYVVGNDFAARLDTPDFIPEGDHVVFNLDGAQGSARLVNPGRSKLRYTIAQVSDPHLYIVPDQTPQDLNGEQTEQIRLNLLIGADAGEYNFMLSSDASAAQRVVVRVPNINAIRSSHAALVRDVVQSLNAHLGDPQTVANLAGMSSNDPRVQEETARVAFEAVSRRSPSIPAGANWLVTADVLAAANLPQLAGVALRKAELTSPATAGTPSAQRLASVVRAQSGAQQVFKTTVTPQSTDVHTIKVSPWLESGDNARQTEKLASYFQQVPGLRAEGLSLQGDALSSKGDNVAARELFKRSAELSATPSVMTRLKGLDSKATAEKPLFMQKVVDPALRAKEEATVRQH